MAGHVHDGPAAACALEAARGGRAADDGGREIEINRLEHLLGAVGIESSVWEDCRVGAGYVRRASHDTGQACPFSVSVKPIQGRAVQFEYGNAVAVANQTLDDRTAHTSTAAGDHERSGGFQPSSQHRRCSGVAMGRGRQGPAPDVEKRQQFARLIGQGVSNRRACQIVGIARKTGTRWRLGRTITFPDGRKRH
jgi:hypothetical protein